MGIAYAGRTWQAVVIAVALLSLLVPAARASLDPSKAITQYIHQSWQRDAGIPTNSVTAIAQTRDGYLWLGTEEGLVRFDGQRFTVFEKSTTPALHSNFVVSLLVDSNQVLWIGTHGGGLTALRKGKFEYLQVPGDFLSAAISSLYQDNGGILWIGTDGGGLVRYDRGAFRRFTKKDGLSGNSVFSIAGDRNGSIWVGTEGGLSRLARGAFTDFDGRDALATNEVRSLFVDTHATLWVGTHGGGLFRLGRYGVKRFTKQDGLSSNVISSVYEDRAGTVWIGTLDNGLNRLVNGQFQSYTGKDGLAGGGVWTIFEDKAGSLWLGGTEGGLECLRDGIFTPITTKEGLVSDTVLSVFEDRARALWIGSNRGLTKWKDGSFTNYSARNGLPDDLVLSIAQDSRGDMWIGTRNGLARLRNNKVETFGSKKDALFGNSIVSTYADRHGEIWVGHRGTLSHYDGKTFHSYDTRDGLPGSLVMSMYQDMNNTLWIGTDGGGLVRFQDGRFTKFTTRDGLPSNGIWSIHGDSDGTLWLGTNGAGLVRFRNGKFITYSRQNGLSDDQVFQILDDNLGRLWMSSNKGIFSVSRHDLDALADGRTKSIFSTLYGLSDGMRSRECNGGFQPAGWRSQDGRLWFPTMKGLVTINPASTMRPQLPPTTLIEGVSIDEKPVGIRSEILVSPGRKHLAFYFTAPYFIAPEKLRFKFMLDGFDKQWIQADTQRIAYYTNVPPASYRFRVISCLGDLCSENSSSVALTILPTFYETRLFYILMAVLAGSLAVTLNRIHVRHLKSKERKLRSLVDERTRELVTSRDQLRRSHDQLETRVAERTEDLSLSNRKLESEICVRAEAEAKAEAASRAKSEFLTNMSHELRTPLNGIVGMTDIMLSTTEDSEQTEYLEIVKSSADALTEIVNNILDFSKIEAHSLELTPAAFLLSDCVSQPVKLLSFRAQEKGLLFNVISEPEIPNALVGDAGRLRQILSNLIDNALRFTSRGSVSLSIGLDSLSDSDVVLRFSVIDTGIGIEKAKQALIFDAFSQVDNSSTRRFGGIGLGLTLCSQLVSLMNGKIWVESEPDHGSSFNFTARFDVVSRQSKELVKGEELALQIN